MFKTDNAFIKGYGSIFAGGFFGRHRLVSNEESIKEDIKTVLGDINNAFIKESEHLNNAKKREKLIHAAEAR